MSQTFALHLFQMPNIESYNKAFCRKQHFVDARLTTIKETKVTTPNKLSLPILPIITGIGN